MELKKRKDIHVLFSENGWFNNGLTEDWLNSIFADTSFFHRVLLWDSYKCHIHPATKQILKRKKVDPIVIPGGCTGLVQAPDISWNKPFKSKMTELYNDWLCSDKITYTKSGNPRAPSKSDLCDMVVSAWNSLSQDLIIKSFIVCGQTKESSPEDISCMKPGKTAHEALSKVKEIWENPLKTDSISNSNDLEDEDELIRNELVIFDTSDDNIEYSQIEPAKTNESDVSKLDISGEIEINVIVCDCNDISVATFFFCKECDEALCDECSNAHKIVKLTRSHKLIDLKLKK